MTLQISYPVMVFWLTATITGLIAWLTWFRRSIPGGRPIFWMAVAVTFWTLTAGLEVSAQSLTTKIVFSKLEYLGSTSTAPLFLTFCLN